MPLFSFCILNERCSPNASSALPAATKTSTIINSSQRSPLQAATDHPGSDDAPQLASPPTFCRLENRIRRKSLFDIVAAFVETFIQSLSTSPKEPIPDFDATDDTIHGDQEQRFFHGHFDSYCFLPLDVMCGDRLLVTYLRPSKIDGALYTNVIPNLVVNRLRQA